MMGLVRRFTAACGRARWRDSFVAGGGFAIGAALGAGLMFLLDPVSGDHRRDLLRRRLATLLGSSTGVVTEAAERASQRSGRFATAVRARLRTSFSGERALEAHVRARLGSPHIPGEH